MVVVALMEVAIAADADISRRDIDVRHELGDDERVVVARPRYLLETQLQVARSWHCRDHSSCLLEQQLATSFGVGGSGA